jgi:group I intron endonuclease
MIIYKTTNLIDGKFYVGKDTKNNPNYLGSGLFLNRAIKIYGREHFEKSILEVCQSIEELNTREIYWIKTLKAREFGYNIAEGGDGGKTRPEPWNKGLKEAPETTAKRAALLTGRKQSEETKAKRNKSLTGIKRSEETKEKLSKANTGKHHSEETKELLRQAAIKQFSNPEAIEAVRLRQTGKKLSEETKAKISASVKKAAQS